MAPRDHRLGIRRIDQQTEAEAGGDEISTALFRSGPRLKRVSTPPRRAQGSPGRRRGALARPVRSARSCSRARSCRPGGLLWALEQPTATPSAACKQPEAQAIGGCFNDTLLSTLIPYLIAMGIGVAVGALIGFLISALMSELPRPGRDALPARLAPASSMSSGPWITALHHGHCASCGSQIAVGDRVHHRPRRTVCAHCG